jgi:hypothetical protein
MGQGTFGLRLFPVVGDPEPAIVLAVVMPALQRGADGKITTSDTRPLP